MSKQYKKRRRKEKTKRSRELHIQGWFDTEDDHEGLIVNCYNQLIDNARDNGYNPTMKDVVGYSILALSKQDISDFVEEKRTTESEAVARISKIAYKIEQILNNVESIQVSGVKAQKLINDIQEVKIELSTEQENLIGSITNQYRSGKQFDFEDE